MSDDELRAEIRVGLGLSALDGRDSVNVTPPQRIQLSRKAGWRLPEGARSVARPTRWGNPFKVERAYGGRWFCFDGAENQFGDRLEMTTRAVALFESALTSGRLWTTTVAEVREQLAGRDLGCWCPLDSPCHAGVLLRIANDLEAK